MESGFRCDQLDAPIMMQRFATASGALLRGLLPSYIPDLQQARTSFRPVEIAGRKPSWHVFTDQVSHTAMTGQQALEQTFHLPVSRMREPSRALLWVLERIFGRALT